MPTEPATTLQPTALPRQTHLTPGLAWAGLMTLLAMTWLGRKYDLPFFYPAILGVLAAAFLGLAAWRVISRIKGAPHWQEIERQRAVIALFLTGSGIFFVCSGIYFLWMYGLAAFGEGVGFILFGVAAATAGWRIKSPAKDDSQSRILSFVQANSQSLGITMLALSIGLVIVYWILLYSGAVRHGRLPEVLGLGMLALVTAGVGMYLWQSDANLSATETRIVVLALGGLVGMSLFIAVVARTFAWRDTTLFGGLAAWQGPNSWRIWLCAYLGMLALALMSGSLLLARADIRTSPLLRRVFFGYNTVVTTLLLLLVLVIGNIVVYAVFPYQFDWTSERGFYTLAESSKQLLHRLDKKAQVYVILSKSSVYHELYTFLDNCQVEAPTKFAYKNLSPDADKAEMKELGDRFPAVFQTVPKFGTVPRRGGLLVVYGDLPDDPKKPVPHAFIAADELFKDNLRERKREEAVTQEFTGELELMKNISSFVAEKRSRVYVLQDNGELKLNAEKFQIRGDHFNESLAEQGGSRFKKYLVDEKFEVFGLSFSAAPQGKTVPGMVFVSENPATHKKDIPKDAGFLIIPAPSQALAPDIIAALDRYLENGGKLLAFVDTFTDRDYTKFINTGLEDLLRKYGIDVTNEYILSPSRNPIVADATPPSNTQNDLALTFKGLEVFAFAPRVLRPGPPGKYDVETLLEVGPKVLIESDPSVLKNPSKHLESLFKSKKLEGAVTRSPTAIAMAAIPRTSKEKKPQIYVFGDAEFISDGVLFIIGQQPQLKNQDLLHMEWVRSPLEYSSERPGFVGPRPRTVTNFKPKADTNYTAMTLVPGWVMMMSLFGLGAGLWIVRRR